MSEPTTFHRFDSDAAWAALDDAQRAAIGALALETVLALHLFELDGLGDYDSLPPNFKRIAQAGELELMRAFTMLVNDTLPFGTFMAPNGQPRFPIQLGGICRGCGCTQRDPCPEGCGWAAEDLCTACAETGGAPA